MAEKRRRYRPDFKERLVELVRSGRSVGSVAREFGASEQAIRNWVKQDAFFKSVFADRRMAEILIRRHAPEWVS